MSKLIALMFLLGCTGPHVPFGTRPGAFPVRFDQVVTVGDVRIETVATTSPIVIDRIDHGVLLTTTNRPEIWIAPTTACPTDGAALPADVPAGFVAGVAEPGPWTERLPGRLYRTLCIEGDPGRVLEVAVISPDLEDYALDMLGRIASAVRPPLEVAPGIAIDRSAYTATLAHGDRAGRIVHGGVAIDVSLVETCLHRDASTGSECVELRDRAMVLAYPVPPPDDTTLAVERVALFEALARSARAKHGDVAWLVDRKTARPRWGNNDLHLRSLVAEGWKVTIDTESMFELRNAVSHARVELVREPCAPFWAAHANAPRRTVSVLPVAAIVDESGGRWIARSCWNLLREDTWVTVELARAPDASTEKFAAALEENLYEGWLAGAFGYARAGDMQGFAIDVFGSAPQFTRVAVVGDIHYGSSDGASFGRVAAGMGPLLARENLRATAFVGYGLDSAPMRARADEEHDGSSLFVGARALVMRGPFHVQASARGAFYFDLDCNISDEQVCGDPDDRSFAPRFGWEAGLRVAAGPTLSGDNHGVYAELRYMATLLDDGDVETYLYLSAGYALW
jgi:hypothetical protein